ncbi:MAG: restriction endonuclease [Rhodoferax sp.]|uniref:restriction endonuclease n=1 Tax=Rhodoferax sp. TaxID=50421 RepID=UPI002624BE85|nr:restriction endonuclease [Rhodoferax sp.]MDD2882976.1 restriction endonuclease [Rhodoferax sp.]
MARKKKSSPLEDMMDLVALLPWWAGVAIAAIGYVVLHRMAAPVQVTAVQPGQVGSLMTQTVIAGLATAGQYIVPLVGLVGAAMSFFRRKQRAALVTDVAQAQSANALDGMSWREFEMLVGEAYRLQGYRVTETGGGGADGGIDLALAKGSEKFLVQCKQWKAYKVGVDVVRELYGVMAAKGATGGFVVTSGRFTDDAKAFAEGRNVQLVDGPKLFSMIKQAKLSLTATAQQPASKPNMAQPKGVIEPMCPQCGSGMVKRTARKGGNAGGEFWGCSKFPTCRGVRQLG